MLDKLPAWLRHLLIMTVAGFLVVVSQGLAHGGVSEINWKDALNAAAAVLVAQLLLIITPLTNQYGLTVVSKAPDATGGVVPPE